MSVLQGQNHIDNRFFEKTRVAVSLGRIELPILPLKRQIYRKQKEYLGEREAPSITAVSNCSSAFVERARLIHKSRVALRITDISATFMGNSQHLFGYVESCGIAPNLRSILRTEIREKLCFMPRLILKPSVDYVGGFEVVELVTFDLVAFQEDDTVDRRDPANRCAQIR